MVKGDDKQIPTRWIVWGVIGAIAIAGVIVTVSDYMQWHRLETKKFGQGVADLQKAAKSLTWEYKDPDLGVRMILPAEWLGQNPKKFIVLRKGFGNEAEKKVWAEELPGGRVVVHQRLAKNLSRMWIVMETTFAEEEWGEWEKTIEEIFMTISFTGKDQ